MSLSSQQLIEKIKTLPAETLQWLKCKGLLSIALMNALATPIDVNAKNAQQGNDVDRSGLEIGGADAVGGVESDGMTSQILVDSIPGSRAELLKKMWTQKPSATTDDNEYDPSEIEHTTHPECSSHLINIDEIKRSLGQTLEVRNNKRVQLIKDFRNRYDQKVESGEKIKHRQVLVFVDHTKRTPAEIASIKQKFTMMTDTIFPKAKVYKQLQDYAPNDILLENIPYEYVIETNPPQSLVNAYLSRVQYTIDNPGQYKNIPQEFGRFIWESKDADIIAWKNNLFAKYGTTDFTIAYNALYKNISFRGGTSMGFKNLYDSFDRNDIFYENYGLHFDDLIKPYSYAQWLNGPMDPSWDSMQERHNRLFGVVGHETWGHGTTGAEHPRTENEQKILGVTNQRRGGMNVIEYQPGKKTTIYTLTGNSTRTGLTMRLANKYNVHNPYFNGMESMPGNIIQWSQNKNDVSPIGGELLKRSNEQLVGGTYFANNYLTKSRIDKFAISSFDQLTPPERFAFRVYMTNIRHQKTTNTADDQQIDKLKLYPNPAADNVTIFNPFGEPLQMSIKTVSGTIVHHQNIDALSSEMIDTSLFPTGVYFISCTDTRNSQVTKKLIITH